jgi:L-alanine-DL-glutamate epimerase-like enolase superfamily enzyme
VKVVGVETVVVGTPWRELTFVELVTDEGLRGVGEARMLNKTNTLLACIDELAGRYVLGMDPFDVERLAWQVHWAEYGRAGEVTQTALAVLDVACHDLIGQAAGVPVWRLLGGASATGCPPTPTAGTRATVTPRWSPASPGKWSGAATGASRSTPSAPPRPSSASPSSGWPPTSSPPSGTPSGPRSS